MANYNRDRYLINQCNALIRSKNYSMVRLLIEGHPEFDLSYLWDFLLKSVLFDWDTDLLSYLRYHKKYRPNPLNIVDILRSLLRYRGTKQVRFFVSMIKEGNYLQSELPDILITDLNYYEDSILKDNKELVKDLESIGIYVSMYDFY